MYNEQLVGRTIPVGNIFLDPNNPRFWSEQSQKTAEVPDAKIPEDGHQITTRTRIAHHALEELQNSILQNGFLPLDRIVVRKLHGLDNKYVVIEGNRRLAALKTLREHIEQGTVSEAGIDDAYLQALVERTNSIEVLVYEGAETKDIAWILQGIRHIGGIRDWMPAQQGKLVADLIDKKGLTFSVAGQRFGLTAQAVGRRYRSYKALEQMRQDDEFQSNAENKYYSLFEEAVRQKEVKEWLGWDDTQMRFTNRENLKQFYSWICPDEDRETKERRLHDPRHIAFLGRLLAGGQNTLIDMIDKHEIGIEAAHQKLSDQGYRYDWSSAFKKIRTLIEDIPNSEIDRHSAEIIAQLNTLITQMEGLRKKAEAVTANPPGI
jgi:hypothetical protein